MQGVISLLLGEFLQKFPTQELSSDKEIFSYLLENKPFAVPKEHKI